jgi:hypothetical protein
LLAGFALIAIVLTGSPEKMMPDDPAISNWPFSCSSLEREICAAMTSGALALTSSMDLNLVTKRAAL